MPARYGAMYEREFGARRRRRFRLVGGIALVAFVAAAAYVLLAHQANGDAGRKANGSLGWTLESVSADARTLHLVREGNTCTDSAGAPIVTETASEVVVRVPRIVGELGHDEACDAISTRAAFLVRLKAPLGRRTLKQPPHGVLDGGDFVAATFERVCARLLSMPRTAPAHDVPWVQDRLASCRARAAADEPPTGLEVVGALGRGRRR